MSSLWNSTSPDAWQSALDSYEAVIARQGVRSLPALDSWYRNELPAAIAAREPAHITLDEMVRITEWKMARGVWRARNLALVRGNSPEEVEELSAKALASVPHPSVPIATLAELAGVGPATASAVLAAVAPDTYPFFDELVAAQIPDSGKLAFTLAYYKSYAAALRERAALLGPGWSAARVERALWADAGGKAGAPR